MPEVTIDKEDYEELVRTNTYYYMLIEDLRKLVGVVERLEYNGHLDFNERDVEYVLRHWIPDTVDSKIRFLKEKGEE